MAPKNRTGLFVAALIVLVLGFAGQTASASTQSTTRQLAVVQDRAKALLMQDHTYEAKIRWWNHGGHWALQLRHDKCWQVNGWRQRRVCKTARRSLAESKQGLVIVRSEIFSEVARYADVRIVASGHSSSPLRRELPEIVEASYKENISPFLVLSITGKESTLGLNSCGKNAWGWNRCNSNGWHSFAEGARAVAHGLKVKYLGQWHKRTIASIGDSYCSCGSSWSSGVGYYMNSVFNAGNGLLWRDAINTVSGT